VAIVAHKDDAKLGANRERVWKKRNDAIRSDVRTHIVIGRVAAEEQVTNTTADEQGLVAIADQRVANRVG
jgi:uncharacterized protein YifE (UPF0438 family)